MPLDAPTLFIVSTCVTGMLGLFLLILWIQDRSIRGLGWWATAYLVGGFAVALWLIEPHLPRELPREIASALLFVAVGMIWNGARAFHGRRVLPFALVAGALIWLIAFLIPAIAAWSGARVVLSSLIIATYAVLTAVELKRERRKPQTGRVRAILIPILHGAVFLSPILIGNLVPGAAADFGSTWFALFALLTLLYVVGTAFIVVVMANEHSLQLHRTAALTDPLTGLFNRRGFFEAAQQLIEKRARKDAPVTLLMFDLDHFKSINDRFGHLIGDEALKVFAHTARRNIRSGDIVGRLGGEEFAAILPSDLAPATFVAERVRLAFQAAGLEIAGHAIGATVSAGAARAPHADSSVAALLAQADGALYRAKSAGRNRVAAETRPPPRLPEPKPLAPPLAPEQAPEPDCATAIS